MSANHTSIFLNEYLDFFASCHLRTFVDGTLGAGGHTEAILHAHPEIECLIAIDRDTAALEIARQRLKVHESKIHFVHGNYSDLAHHVQKCGISSVDGMFFDLGVSSMQFDQAHRGFSFNKQADLDMRMDRTSALTAAEIVNTYSEKKIGEILREFGEEPRWRAAAAAIVSARAKQPITTTQQLVELLYPILRNRGKLHPLTLAFQGLRIAVNGELCGLQALLPQALQLLTPEGRMGVISFHSLEDRLVKQSFLSVARASRKQRLIAPPQYDLLTKKPLEPTAEEQRKNPRSRSAKLRFIARKRERDEHSHY